MMAYRKKDNADQEVIIVRSRKLLLAVTATVILSLALGIVGLGVGKEAKTGEDFEPSSVLEKAAEKLGIEKAKLEEALSQAYLQTAKKRIDQRVKEGWLGEKRAELIKKRMEKRMDEKNFPRAYFMRRGRGHSTGPTPHSGAGRRDGCRPYRHHR